MATLIVDFGLVILIWMTQLIVYPSFEYYQEADLKQWHKIYTSNITLLVLPLMALQAFFCVYRLMFSFDWIGLIVFSMVIGAWINTFFYAVPLHGKITKGKDVLQSARSLIRVNWYRTILWTMVFIVNLWVFVKQQL